MPRRTKTILEREIEELPLGEMVLEAMAHPGMSYRCRNLAVDTVPSIVIVACGPAADVWLEIARNYQIAMTQGEPNDDASQEVPEAR